MASVFEEDMIDIKHWENVDSDVNKLKIGEIFQLKDSTLSMSCINCFQEFEYYTEFSLHIEEHYLRGDIAKLKEIKDEMHNSSEVESMASGEMSEVGIDEMPEVECTIIKSEVDEFPNDNSEIDTGWSDEDCDHNSDDMTLSEAINNGSIMEGTDYEKINNDFKCLTCNYITGNWKHFQEHLSTHSNASSKVMCPLCSKLFANFAYVQKHVNRTHQQRITINEIKEAQPYSRKTTVAPVRTVKNQVKPYAEGKDYRKINEKFQCLTCKREMIKFDHMREHLLTHNSQKNVLCPFCAKAFITEAYVRKHVNRTHKKRITALEIKLAQSAIDVSETKTQWLSEKSKEAEKIENKPKSHSSPTEGEIRCLYCDKRFTKARYAQKHIRLIHAKLKTITEVIKFQPSCATPTNVFKSDPGTVDNDQTKESTVLHKNSDISKHFECYECHKQFVGVNSLRIHMKLHSGIKYKCPYCTKLFAMKSYVRDHIVIMHGIKRDDIPKESIVQATGHFSYIPRPHIEVFECYLCRNQYRKRNRLREHMHSHVSGPYLCVICGAVYKSTDTLRHHMERHKANPDEPHQCSECGKMYPTRRYMLSHYRTVHLNKKRKQTVEKKPEVECQICDKKFLNQHNLNQHMTVHKRDPNDLVCTICGWEFKERSNLRQHMESHGNNKTSCNICKKVLSIRYLQEHMKIHTGNKEFQCCECGKQFVSRERLRRHMVRHSGDPKYKCDLCPKAYTRSDKLLYHRRTHDQQMTHTCPTCGKGFFSIKSLRKHENKHYLEHRGILKVDAVE